MAAITTVISFFVLLLATLSHSAPLDIQPESSSSSWRGAPKVKPTVGHVSDFRSRMIVDRQTTDFPMHHNARSSEEKNSAEVTTDFSMHHNDRSSEEKSSAEVTTDFPVHHNARSFEQKSSAEVTTDFPVHHNDRSSEEKNSAEVTTEIGSRSPRTFEDDSSPASTDMNETSESEESSSSSAVTETNVKREVEDVFTTTWETSTQFNQRAIRPTESQEDVQSSTASDSVNEMEMTTNAEPMSSGHSFGKSTGLLNDEPSSTSENLSSEESTKQTPVKSQRVTKTISIIPGKITETKIYANLPSKTSVVVQPIEEEQLSEVQTPSNVKKTKSDN